MISNLHIRYTPKITELPGAPSLRSPNCYHFCTIKSKRLDLMPHYP